MCGNRGLSRGCGHTACGPRWCACFPAQPQSGRRCGRRSVSPTEGWRPAQAVPAPRWPFSEPASARSFSALLFKSGKLNLRFQFLILKGPNLQISGSLTFLDYIQQETHMFKLWCTTDTYSRVNVFLNTMQSDLLPSSL